MPKYFEFEVSLLEIKPRIWRRFLLKKTASFMDLHEAIQDAGDWDDSHLFAFRPGKGHSGRDIAGIPAENDLMGYLYKPVPDAKKVKLSSYFDEEKKKCVYEYDFGDSWLHAVKLRKIVDSPEKFNRRLLAGARAFPLEDCGGAFGYYNCLEVLAGGEDEDDLKDWIGDWAPERFDLEKMKKSFDR